jgi:type II secretory pathway pseudopilin PulG
MSRWVRRHDDAGIAMVVAIALMGIVSALLVTLVIIAVYESNASGRDRQRSAAVTTAEARIDSLIATVQSTAPADLPCGALSAETLSVITDDLTTSATVTYFDEDGDPVDCVDVPTVEVAQASITATSLSDPIAGQPAARRTVETLLRLNPTYGNDLDKAIFGNGGVTLANKADIYGQDGQPNADVYTNGNVTCNNNQHYYGSIFAQGNVSMSNTCTVEVDVQAKGSITATNPGVTINGRALSSNGSINLGPAALGQQARASGSVSGNICSTAGKCFPGVSVPPPAALDFPILQWDTPTQTEWASEGGYTNVVTIPFDKYTCGWWNGGTLTGFDGQKKNLNGKVDGAAAWIYENAWKLSGPTVLVSTCAQGVSLQGVGLQLNDNLAVFSTNGVSFSGNSQITSTTSDPHNLYLIQPYDARTLGCSETGIALDNQVTVDSTINTLLYSPCNIRKANLTTHYGQIYAGGVAQIDNQLTMYFEPLPVWGVKSVSSTIESYDVEILYTRENQ